MTGMDRDYLRGGRIREDRERMGRKGGEGEYQNREHIRHRD